MRDFFRGWRRKIGVMTLLMACVFMGGWIRSSFRQDSIEFCPLRSIHCISSGYGYFAIVRFRFPSRDDALSVSTVNSSSWKSLNLGWWSAVITEDFEKLEPWNGAEFESHWEWNEFLIGCASFTTINQHFDKAYVFTPYWSIVLPLTLLSAYLLLNKPGPSKLPEVTKPPDEAQVTHA